MADTTPPPGRARTTVRDLLGSLAVLLVVIVAIVGFGRGCAFSPGGPTVDPGTAPSIDASRALSDAASSVDFPIRRPNLPDNWRSNSSSTSAVGSGASVVVRTGWVTPLGAFAQLSQSSAQPPAVVAAETGQPDPRPTGTIDIDGIHWTIYPGRRDEQAWVTRLDTTTTLITGSANEPEFRLLAKAIQTATPLPRP